jgi:predicted phosphodiesterase
VKIVHNSRNVLTVYFEINKDFEQWVLLVSDQHHDSTVCNRRMEKEHLDLAMERNALIISAGDTFDMMQGKFDPRKTYTNMRKEYTDEMNKTGTQNYFDIVIKDAVNFYKPYAKNILVIGRGNHDTSVENHHGLSPVGNLVSGLNISILDSGHIIQAGGYGGWVKFNFSAPNNQGMRSSMRLKYFHGSGGDAPVTRGMINTARQGVYLPDADIVLNGHNHQSYTTSIARERLNDSGKILFDVVDYIRTPGYNQGYGDGHSGWESEGHPPKPIGCVWMKLFFHNRVVCREFTPSVRGCEI